MRFCVAVLCLMAGVCRAQPVTFEVASIKPSRTDSDSASWHSRPDYLVMKNQSLRRLVAIAFGVTEERVTGGPKWADSDRFDVEARAAGPAKDPELLTMLQAMLAERFAFAFHRETRSTPAYALSVVKGGLKIRPVENEGGSRSNSTRGRIVAERITLPRFADALTRLLGTPVVDMTGVQGVYTFTLEWAPETPGPDPPAGPSLFEVLPERLGLKLDNRKVAVETIVIDRAERPTAN